MPLACNEDFLGFLTFCWEAAPATASSLRPQLVINQQLVVAQISAGSIASVGKNSTNQTYKGHGPGGLTLTEVGRVYTRLIDDYDACQQQLSCAYTAAGLTVPNLNGTADWDGADVGQQPIGVYQMLRSLFSSVPVNVRSDITNLNLVFGPCGGNWPYGPQPCGAFSW